ncbi:hypothetical protein M422DRAFT_265610 [Sphaerobolus stellatus SS14]|uniref:Endonuclease/exonuclease/phosphatase domain-containing protein n=1 Tax=Sphaerobolus stellatus (strain SS14) TaxID=990650 RepID=A0A0C9V582_SPHS4|nr:hypothetical protein M422DRAFT_265610 [Sphaerobolus stellatus SS14]
MREDKIAILSAQETHVDMDKLNRISKQFEKQLLIYNSADPTSLNGKGVSIILNKKYTHWKDATFTDIVPGRALMLQLPWGDRGTLNCLAVYAPNDPGENACFWKSLTTRWRKNCLPNLDIVLGYFNIVEDSLDRHPARADPNAAVEALQEFKTLSLLSDGWR